MHTVVEPWCIGCELCVPPCPVDCIDMVPARGEWTAALKHARPESAVGERKAAMQAIRSRRAPDRKSSPGRGAERKKAG